MQATFENSDLWDSDRYDDSDSLDSRNDYGGQSSSNQWHTFPSKAGVTWNFYVFTSTNACCNW